ncbi:MAG: D-tyrosyl-tRNA(Tyr) deacylase [Oscillospiraceae bacterium]|nr:D-tyrosyl-tRNA(Tyr) deacylase [Oscillospiraceae bacterium]
MKLVVQRVTEGAVSVDGNTVGQIGLGYVVFLGVGEQDTEETARKLADKLIKIRIFADADGKTNLSVKDVDGGILVISQFTLYADCRKNRPSFCHAGNPELAEHLYEVFLSQLRTQIASVQHGIFGADMKVSLCNDGPFTVLLEA